MPSASWLMTTMPCSRALARVVSTASGSEGMTVIASTPVAITSSMVETCTAVSDCPAGPTWYTSLPVDATKRSLPTSMRSHQEMPTHFGVFAMT